MPALVCPVCRTMAPVRWVMKEKQWRFWPHGPEDKRCAGSDTACATRP